MKKYSIKLYVMGCEVYWEEARTFKGACRKMVKWLRKSKICDVKTQCVSNYTGEIMIEMGR